MKNRLLKFSIVAAFALGLGAAPHLISQQAPREPVSPPRQAAPQQPPTAAPTEDPAEQPGQPSAARQARDLEGARVVNTGGVSLGVVESVIIDVANGEIPFVVIQSRVEATEGELHIVPRNAVQEVPPDPRTPEEPMVRLDIDEERWLQAPAFDPEEITALEAEDRTREIHEFFGTDPEAVFGAPGAGRDSPGARTGQPGRELTDPDIGAAPGEQTQPGERAGFPDTEFGEEPGEREVERPEDTPRRDDPQAQEEERPGVRPGQPDPQQRTETEIRRREAGQRQTPQFVRSTDVTEQQVTGADGETIGQIQDFILDPRTGQVAWATIQPDAAFETGEGQVFGVSPHSLVRGDDGRISVELDRERVRQAEPLDRSAMQDRARRFGDDPQGARERPEIFRFEREDTQEFGAPHREAAEPDEPAERGDPAEPAERMDPSRTETPATDPGETDRPTGAERDETDGPTGAERGETDGQRGAERGGQRGSAQDR